MLRSTTSRGDAPQAPGVIVRRARHRRVLLGAAIGVVVLASAGCRDQEPEERSPYLVTVDLQPDVNALGATEEDGGDERAQAASRRLRALGALAGPALIAALDREPPAVRIATAGLLAELAADAADQAALGRLERLAHEDSAAEVRAAAIVALADVGDARSATVVEAALQDRDADVRLAAAGACPGFCTTDAALGALARMAVSAANTGHALAARRVLTTIREHGETAAAAEAATRRAAEATLAPDAGASSAQQVQAALLLADVGDSRGERLLLAAAGKPPVPALRVHAVYALGRVGGAQSVDVLAVLLRDPGVAPYAVDALTRLAKRGVAGAPEALDAYHGPRPSGPVPPP